MTKQEFDQLKEEIDKAVKHTRSIFTSWREGQTISNLLETRYCELMVKARSWSEYYDVDPFYDDNNIPKFWRFLEIALVDE